jgi:hypothetical protein
MTTDTKEQDPAAAAEALDVAEPDAPSGAPWRRRVLFAAIGASLGLAYYLFIGCSSGGCAITGNPYASTAYGAMIGYLVTAPR